MARDFRSAAWTFGFAAAFVQCAATAPDVGGESHFFCTRNADCPASVPVCNEHVCRAGKPLPNDASPSERESAIDDLDTSVGGGGSPSTGGRASTGGAANTSAGGTTGSAGIAGGSPAASDASDASEPVCVDHPDASLHMPDDCSQLDNLVLTVPRLSDDGGNGILSPGEGATIRLSLREINGIGANWYPGVHFSTPSDAGVVIDGSIDYYAALACDSLPIEGRVVLPADIPLRTVVVVRAQITMLNAECPLAFSRDILISVGDPLP